MGLSYFSFNIEPTACTGICRVQDCPEDSVNFFVIGAGSVVVGGEEGGVAKVYLFESALAVGAADVGVDVVGAVVVTVACGAVTVSSKEIGS